MRIAFVTLGYQPLRTSGLDMSGERLVTALLEAGHEVTVIAGQSGSQRETHAHPLLHVYRVPLDRTDWIGFAVRAAALRKRLGAFDVTHFWDVHFGFAYRGAYVASLQHSFHQRINSLGNAAFTTLKGGYRYVYYTLARYLAEIPALRRADGLLAGSATTAQEFIRYYPLRPERVRIARHGVDTSFFQRTERATEVRRRLGLGLQEPVLLFAGFITPRKGLEVLAQAFADVHPRPKLVLVGKWRNEAYRQQVYRLLEPFKRRVIEAGFVADEEMPAYYSMADAYVSPSLLEGFGLPIAEALACKTPVVACDSGAVAEVMGPGGILVPPGDPVLLARALSDLLANPGLGRDKGEQGYIHVRRNFSIQTMLETTLAAYNTFCTSYDR
ncbi:MAG: glycosyltransferase family 4 protein [Chloroflexota bacterium]